MTNPTTRKFSITTPNFDCGQASGDTRNVKRADTRADTQNVHRSISNKKEVIEESNKEEAEEAACAASSPPLVEDLLIVIFPRRRRGKIYNRSRRRHTLIANCTLSIKKFLLLFQEIYVIIKMN